MNRVGYYRYATIAGSTIAFVCEDDLWTLALGESAARRLSAGVGEISAPRLSPDGRRIAFVSREEGHPEVALIDTAGSPITRLTHLGGESCLISGWSADGSDIYFVSDGHAHFSRDTGVYTVKADGGTPQNLGLGHARWFTRSAAGTVIGRNADDPARWKRYRGGTAGDLWVDAGNTGTFKRLITLAGNLVAPMWIGERIYFLSDHEGIGNIYSCTVNGTELRRHTHEAEYYVRYPHSDGKQIIYTVAGAIKILDTDAQTVTDLVVETPSSAPQTARRFISGADFLEDVAPSPSGERIALVSRGQTFSMALWDEAALRIAGGGQLRTRLACWLHDGERLAYISDAAGFERVEVRGTDLADAKILTTEPRGRFNELAASPVDDILAFTTHRHELGIITVGSGEIRMLDASPAAKLGDIAFSPDGRYIAYAISIAPPPATPNPDCTIIRIVEIASGEIHDVTSLLRSDRSPAWDPEGKFLALLSTRDFHPVYDALQFDLSFPQAARPFLITLQANTPSPFQAKTAPIYRDDKDDHDEKDDKDDADESADKAGEGKDDADAKPGDAKDAGDAKDEKARKTPPPIVIDFAGIEKRMLGFPVEEGDFGQIVAAKGRVYFTRFPLKGIDPNPRSWDQDDRGGTLQAYDFQGQRTASVAENVGTIVLGADHRTLLYRSDDRLRVIDAGGDLGDDAPDEPDDDAPARKNGWIDVSRLVLELEPRLEWAQMYHEAWRLQHEHFWDESMSNVDWHLIRERYARLLPLIRTRTELSDLIWEMQGELGTSHAYEIGGDHRRPTAYRRGFLGADFTIDPQTNVATIARIIRGDSWDRHVDSPLATPGVDIREGDRILAVGDRKLGPTQTLDAALVHTAQRDVQLLIERGTATHRITVKTLRDERPLRYRDWVETNRRYVHERTGGRAGYIHIPDMGPWGFAEFHRGFLAEFQRAGMVVDARHNRGGHISPLLLEKLARKRVGYDVPRYGPALPYPPESIGGPLIALTDQFAGSDGDIFSHCFKLYGLGPLIGKRTWGGVIGINPSHELVDGTVTTQPEYSFWFTDVGWGVENYGTDPDIDIDITPQDSKAGRDPQMDRGLDVLIAALDAAPPTPPAFTPRPRLTLPTLPPA